MRRPERGDEGITSYQGEGTPEKERGLRGVVIGSFNSTGDEK